MNAKMGLYQTFWTSFPKNSHPLLFNLDWHEVLLPVDHLIDEVKNLMETTALFLGASSIKKN